MDLWITGVGSWKSVWTDIAAHTLFPNPDRTPGTHTRHSCDDYYPLPLNEKDSATVLQK